jgi:hypothetical protein
MAIRRPLARIIPRSTISIPIGCGCFLRWASHCPQGELSFFQNRMSTGTTWRIQGFGVIGESSECGCGLANVV